MPNSSSGFENDEKKFKLIRNIVVAGILLLLVAGGYLFLRSFDVTAESVKVDGNVHYTDEEICRIVLGEKTRANSIFLMLKYKNRSITDVPFVERIDVSVKDRKTVQVNVYEKALAGYVSYLGTYLYFDKDGIVVENANVLTPSIPEVSGLKYNHFVLHEPLPVENKEIFQKVLNMTNLLQKHGIAATKIQFDQSETMTFHFNKVRVSIGDEKEIDEKIMRLAAILPSLEGKSGLLHMETYSANSKDITFESDEVVTEKPSEEAESETETEESAENS